MHRPFLDALALEPGTDPERVDLCRSLIVKDRAAFASALAANLMGALAGALLQSVTFVTGIKALLLIVAALYLAAVLVRPRTATNAAAA